MNIFLDKIVAHKVKELSILKKEKPVEQFQDSPFYWAKTISLNQSLMRKELSVIAEYKKKSPSKGILNTKTDVETVVENYEKHGASAISILTNEAFFGGHPEHIVSVRKSCNIPILRKEFIIDSYQIFEAKSIGADAILLIACILSKKEIEHFFTLARTLKLEVLFEVFSEKCIDKLPPDAQLIGINNRNLHTFEVNFENSVRLIEKLPQKALKVAESGIYKPIQIRDLERKGFDAFLIGEHFMKTENPGKTFAKFLQKAYEI